MKIQSATYKRKRFELKFPHSDAIRSYDSRDCIFLELGAFQHSVRAEISPLPGFCTEDIEHVEKLLAMICKQLTGVEARNAKGVFNQLEQEEWPPSLRWGLSVALLKFQARLENKTIEELFGKKPNPLIPVGALYNKGRQYDWPFRTLKLKISRESLPNLDKQLQQIQSMFAHPFKFRLDANGALRTQDIGKLSRATQNISLDYVEDPFHSICFDELPFPLAIDRPITNYRSLPVLPKQSTAVIKPMCFGSFWEILEIIEKYKTSGHSVVLSSSLESPLGLQAIRILHSTAALKTDCGLDTDCYYT